MITLIVEYSNDTITYLDVYGHADFDEHGKDIVCAGVSGLLMSNMMYAQNHALGVFEAQQEEGHVTIHVIESNAELQVLLAAVVEGVSLMQQQYPAYITIKKQ